MREIFAVRASLNGNSHVLNDHTQGERLWIDFCGFIFHQSVETFHSEALFEIMSDTFLTRAGLTAVVPPQSAGQIFQIHGELSQVVHIPLAPGQKVQCEPGTMVYSVSLMCVVSFEDLYL